MLQDRKIFRVQENSTCKTMSSRPRSGLYDLNVSLGSTMTTRPGVRSCDTHRRVVVRERVKLTFMRFRSEFWRHEHTEVDRSLNNVSTVETRGEGDPRNPVGQDSQTSVQYC